MPVPLFSMWQSLRQVDWFPVRLSFEVATIATVIALIIGAIGFYVFESGMLEKSPTPNLEEVREGLAGNLCRCTGYAQICEAVAEAAAREDVTQPKENRTRQA